MAGHNDLRIGQGLFHKLIYIAGVIFLLTPLLLLIIFSFNASENITSWQGFSFSWYKKAFDDTLMWISIRNSIVVAVFSTILSTILGTMAALALGKRFFRGRALFQNLLYIPIILPEIVFGISLLILFNLIKFPLGLISVTFAHVTFSISFVTIIVLGSVRNFDPEIENAALNLGATPFQAFFHVVLPNISAGVISGALFAFTMSIDDFVVTYFTTGSGFNTFPLKVYSMLKFGINPSINAVSTVLILTTCAAIAGAGLLRMNKEKLEGKLKYITGGLLTLTVLVLCGLFLTSSNRKVVYFGNYSSYFDESILADFKKETGIEVVMEYFNDQNELLTKLQSGACSYDLMIVSDYFVDIMKNLKLILPFKAENVPNRRFIDPEFRKLFFDPSGEYYIPYAYGLTGIAYNAEKVHDPIDTWEIFWNPSYKDRMTIINDMRTAFAIPFTRLGYSINDTDPTHLLKAKELLLSQKPLLRKYESNLVKDMFRSGEIDFAQLWNGEALRLNMENPKFKFAAPREGCIIFVDNFCLRNGSPNTQEVQKFVNYLLRPDVSAKNMKLICYAMPHEEARKLLPPALRDSPIMYPPLRDESKYLFLRDIGTHLQEVSKAWTEVKGQ
jgi:spermidine/putrescine transport system permease protein